ncbi:MAG: hypothetical protein GY851_24330 [bacterium]|nr:hypothetical protein [bacterium]
MGLHIGIDVGTTSISGVAIDTDRCETLAQAVAPNSAEVTSSSDRSLGRSEWDMDAMTAGAIALVADLARQIPALHVAGVGVTGQMHGMVLVGSDQAACTPFVGWQDARCLEQASDGRTYLEGMTAIGGSLFAASGCRPATGYMASTLFWLSRNDAMPSDATACFAPDYVVGQLTGAGIATDPTNAASAGVYDVRADRWNADLIYALGLEDRWFPEMRTSCSRAGGLSGKVAGETGLTQGIPVSVACGDNQASFAGSVAKSTDSVLVNVGTGGQVSAYTEDAVSSDILDLRPFLQGGFLLVGSELSGGRSYQVLRDFMSRVGAQVFGLSDTPDVYERLNDLAAAVPPGVDGLRCDPVFAGSRLEPNARAEWHGMDDANFTPGHMARALLEGLADRFHALYDEMLRAGAPSRRYLVGSGNGVRHNPLLRDILAARFHMPVDVARHTEEAATGAALCAAVAAGEFTTIHDASRQFVLKTTG